jgi:hypothetical protein
MLENQSLTVSNRTVKPSWLEVLRQSRLASPVGKDFFVRQSDVEHAAPAYQVVL